MKIRLDQYLCQHGLVPSRERAKALIMAGVVFVDQQKADKAGMMIADYYLLRKRKLNIKDFYVEGGEYTFHKNWNPLAFVAYIIGTIAGLCNPDWGFLTAMFFGCVSYYLIMRFYGAKKYNQTSMLVNFKS